MSLEITISELKKQLAIHAISVVDEKGKRIFLDLEYTIEIENERLFKLLHADQVVAPFDDMKELCEFIRMDMQLNA